MYMDWQLFILGYFNNYFIVIYLVLNGIYILINYRQRLLDFVLAITLSQFISEGLKFIFNSPRPMPIRPDIMFEGGSFPSTHTTIAFTAFFFLLISLKNSSKLISFLSLVGAVLIAFLRIISHAHYLTDVLAGIIIAIVPTIIFRYYDISERRIK